MLLSELRAVIREYLLLVEVRIIADEAKGADEYRVVSLAANNDVGKIILIPMGMEKYGKDGVDGMLTTMGLKQQPPSGSSLEDRIAFSEKHPFHNTGGTFAVNIPAETIDVDSATYKNYKGRRQNNAQTKSYTIPHEGSEWSQVKPFQKALKAVMAHDKRVTQDFKIVGNPIYDGQTISDILNQKDVGDQIAKGGHFDPVTLYHGTSDKRWQSIKQKGLQPNNAPKVYGDLVAGYSEFNVYVTTSVAEAENYATRAAIDDRSKAVVLKLIVRDPQKFTFDEDGANWLTIPAPGAPWTKMEKGEPFELHFRHVYQKDDGTPNRWQDWPNAKLIWSLYQKKIIKNLHRAGTIGYKGGIPAKDITMFSTYKPSSMKHDPDDAEFAAARDATMSTYSQPTDVVKSKPKPTPSTSNSDKTYKIYGRKAGAPAHTRYKGKAYHAGKDTSFKNGESARVAPDGKNLKVTKADDDYSQLWNPDE